MKRINIAYAVLREKLAREAFFRERQANARPARRYPGQDAHARGDDMRKRDPEPRGAEPRNYGGQPHQPQARAAQAHASQDHTAQTHPGCAAQNCAAQAHAAQAHAPQAHAAQSNAPQQNAAQAHVPQAHASQARADSEPQPQAYSAAQRADGEREAFSVIDEYFRLICGCDYQGAYNCLSNCDKRYITQESFVKWRQSVARLYPMRGYGFTSRPAAATVSFKDGRVRQAFRFRVAVSEDNLAEEPAQPGDVEKLVINENSFTEPCSWKVFLGYKGVNELTRTFDDKFETKRKRDITKRWEEYNAGLSREYDMHNLAGMRKAVSREIYRQQRFGGALSFAALSINAGGASGAGREELLRSAAGTIVGALRETDVPAYAGDGVFAILFVELKKKNLEEIVRRLVGKIREKAGPQLGRQAVIDYAFESWSGHSPADMDGINKVIDKVNKKV